MSPQKGTEQQSGKELTLFSDNRLLRLFTLHLLAVSQANKGSQQAQHLEAIKMCGFLINGAPNKNNCNQLTNMSFMARVKHETECVGGMRHKLPGLTLIRSARP